MTPDTGTPEAQAQQRRFFTALFKAHLLDWTPAQHVQAVDGYAWRVHVDHAHPNQVEEFRALMEGKLTTEAMAAGEASAPLVDAWLFGYRFRDTDGAAGEGGAGDGPPGAETREP